MSKKHNKSENTKSSCSKPQQVIKKETDKKVIILTIVPIIISCLALVVSCYMAYSQARYAEAEYEYVSEEGNLTAQHRKMNEGINVIIGHLHEEEKRAAQLTGEKEKINNAVATLSDFGRILRDQEAKLREYEKTIEILQNENMELKKERQRNFDSAEYIKKEELKKYEKFFKTDHDIEM